MLGRPHTELVDTLVVTDVFPLPVEGFETRVIADDEQVINYMIQLSELLDDSRTERLMGWYHRSDDLRSFFIALGDCYF